MNSHSKRRIQGTLALGAATIGIVAVALLGCTSRRQYAINESVLISERRQLEDEIYRVQFELRDALEENERLRDQLDAQNPNAEAAKKGSSRRARKTTAPVYQDRQSPVDDNFYPGGDALRVSANARGGVSIPEYRDYAADDESRSSARGEEAQTRQRSSAVSQVSHEEAVDVPFERDDAFDEQEQGNEEDVVENDLSETEEDEWEPLPER